MRPNAYLSSLLFLLLLAGCAERLEMPSVIDGGTDSPGRTIEDGTPIDVPFSVSYSPLTKSSLTIGEDTVNDVNIVAFKNGVRTTFVYTTPDSDITLQLLKGESYNIYAVANVGAISIPSSESDFLDYSYSIDSIDDLNGGFPMWWKLEGFTAGVLTSPVDIELERLVAKVRLSLMAPDMEGFEVTSVRLCQAASTIRPFAASGSRALSGETLDGDYASAADLTTINNGGSICFYTFENCQGTLLEGNTDPWNKVPDNMGGKDDVCTYIEITCEHDGSFLLDGTVTYRMYLGADNCSNFDILRNKNYNLTLTATYAGMSQADISWKVDVDCEVSNAGDAGIQVGAHAEDDLYIGEVIVMGFSTSQAFDDYNGGEPFDCELVLVKNGVESDAAWFEEINDGGYNKSYDCVMHCVDEINGAELYLKKDDHLTCKLPLGAGKRIYIQKPGISLTRSTNSPIVINGESINIEAHIIDNNNQEIISDVNTYAFDLNVFDGLWSSSVNFNGAYHSVDGLINNKTVKKRLEDCMSLEFERDETGLIYTANLVNTGEYADVCYDLSYNYDYHCDSDQYTIFASNDKCISGEIDLSYDISKISIHHYTTMSFFEYDDSEDGTWFAIKNKSNIALSFTGFVLDYNKMDYEQSRTLPGTVNSHSVSLVSPHSEYIVWGQKSFAKPIWGNVCKCLCFPPTLSYQSTYDQDEGFRVETDPQLISVIDDDEVLYYAMEGGGEVSRDYVMANYNYSIPTETLLEFDFSTVNYDRIIYDNNNNIGTLNPYLSFHSVDYGVESPYMNNIFDGFYPFDFYSKLQSPIVLNFNSSSNGLKVTVNNPRNANINFSVEATASGTCSWRSYSTASWNYTPHSCMLSANTTTSISSGNVVLLSANELNTLISNLNLNYWHNCSSSAVAAQGNRYSKFTIPEDISYEISVSVNRLEAGKIFLSSSAFTPSTTLYSKTADGCYHDSGSTNPDGTDRDLKNIKNSPTMTGASTTSVSSLAQTIKINETFSYIYIKEE